MPSLHSPKIEVLIVDDEVQARELLSEFCRAQGYEVATANDGRAAIAALTRRPRQFGIVITDLQLPGADGFEVLTAARQANPSVYVVMITGYASIDSAVRAVREGAYDYSRSPSRWAARSGARGASKTACRIEEASNRDLAAPRQRDRRGLLSALVSRRAIAHCGSSDNS